MIPLWKKTAGSSKTGIVKGRPLVQDADRSRRSKCPFDHPFAGHARSGVGRFDLSPITGKTHQLRLHMSGLGFRILNDRYYPELQPERAEDYAQPLRLIAKTVRFRDPLSGKELEFSSAREPPLAGLFFSGLIRTEHVSRNDATTQRYNLNHTELCKNFVAPWRE